jgi:hypothetical protein
MEKVLLECKYGLGSKLLDMIGFCVFCDLLGFGPVVNLDAFPDDFKWGTNLYEETLFDFENLEIVKSSDNHENIVTTANPSSTFSPYKVFQYLQLYNVNVSFENVSLAFEKKAKQIIKPCDKILQKLPDGLENTYGIHLRFSDKVKGTFDYRHQNNINEFLNIRNKLLADIRVIIQNEEKPSFLFVSEEKTWRNDFIEMVQKICKEEKKEITIIESKYENTNADYGSVYDLFSLSKCKIIMQGIKYSSFSTLAALIGMQKIKNYSNNENEYYDKFSFHAWNSVIEINGVKTYDEEKQAKVCGLIQNMIAKY